MRPMPDKKRVLFVDDEPRILDGLRRMLRRLRYDWDMSFVETGSEALARLARESFDVIVTDMHMPRMTGAQLLTEVRRRYPHLVRIVLSGASGPGDILNTLGPIHQYLSKPCEADSVQITLARVAVLPNLLVDDRLQQLLSQIETLPSLPARYDELIRELESPAPSLDVIGDIVARDMGLAVKVMQLAQSVVFSSRPVSSLAEAVMLLGLDMFQTIAASGQVFARFDPARMEGLSLAPLWEHSVLVGRLARRIAIAEGADRQTADYAAIAGLLHDVGKLVLAANLPERYASALALASGAGLTSSEAERQIFHATHAEVGAYLLSLWGLPDPIVAATAFHHNPRSGAPAQFNAVTAVYAADYLAHQPTEATQLDVAYLASIGLAGRLPDWQNLYHQTIHQRYTP
jgi:HD-like signal output (HDOD) protein/CheY-like chemotaxis protein